MIYHSQWHPPPQHGLQYKNDHLKPNLEAFQKDDTPVLLRALYPIFIGLKDHKTWDIEKNSSRF
jgi:hypothetical protein